MAASTATLRASATGPRRSTNSITSSEQRAAATHSRMQPCSARAWTRVREKPGRTSRSRKIAERLKNYARFLGFRSRLSCRAFLRRVAGPLAIEASQLVPVKLRTAAARRSASKRSPGGWLWRKRLRSGDASLRAAIREHPRPIIKRLHNRARSRASAAVAAASGNGLTALT